MILTSLRERSARGSAADTAARPPTRTKSSISVVTKSTLKPRPRTGLNHEYARLGPFFSFADGGLGNAHEDQVRVRAASLPRRHNLGSGSAGRCGGRSFKN